IAVSTIGQIQADNSYDWTAFFDPIKDAQFDPARKPVFHYALSVAGNIPDLSRGLDSNGLPQGAAGLSRGGYPVGGSDFMVALEVNPPAWAASGVFMHELGHNLGLSHGGDLEPDETEI